MLWAFGKGIMNWCEKWEKIKVLVDFKGDNGIHEVLMEGKDWDRSNMTYKVREDGQLWYKFKIWSR